MKYNKKNTKLNEEIPEIKEENKEVETLKVSLETILKIVITSLLVLLVLLSLILGRKKPITQAMIEKTPNLDNIISDIKKENEELTLDYESTTVKEFTSLVFSSESLPKEDVKGEDDSKIYKSVIIDTKTGKEITFQDLIKKDKLKTYQDKELELLNAKYPEFIATSITENSSGLGHKLYYVKDYEVIVFYYDYEIPYDYDGALTLTINYQEIKDYLTFTPSLDVAYQNESGYEYSPDKKAIALTFDDGPSRTYNPKILEVLEQNKAHATFFMVGNMMDSCGKCILDTYKSGNEVASHTYEHMNIRTKSIDKVAESLFKVNNIYNSVTGDTIKYLRPPYGAYNKTNLENINMPLILWDLDTEDWRYRDIDHIVDYILNNAHDGGIILMHELYETSYEALKVVLPKLYAMGYQVVSVSELAQLKNRTLEAGKAYLSLR